MRLLTRTISVTMIAASGIGIGAAATTADTETVVIRVPIEVPVTTTTTTSTTVPLVAESQALATRGEQVEVVTTTTTAPLAWQGALPEHYGPGTGCNREQASTIAIVMWGAGASDDSVEWMLKTISRESKCDSAAYNGNRSTGDNSYGLCQINALAGWFKPGHLLESFDPDRFATDFTYNARACALLWSKCGRGPWNYGNYYCSTPSELR